MKLKQALKVINGTKIHMVIEATEGHFESKTLDYLAASDRKSFGEALNFASKWSDKKVSFITPEDIEILRSAFTKVFFQFYVCRIVGLFYCHFLLRSYFYISVRIGPVNIYSAA